MTIPYLGPKINCPTGLGFPTLKESSGLGPMLSRCLAPEFARNGVIFARKSQIAAFGNPVGRCQAPGDALFEKYRG